MLAPLLRENLLYGEKFEKGYRFLIITQSSPQIEDYDTADEIVAFNDMGDYIQEKIDPFFYRKSA